MQSMALAWTFSPPPLHPTRSMVAISFGPRIPNRRDTRGLTLRAAADQSSWELKWNRYNQRPSLCYVWHWGRGCTQCPQSNGRNVALLRSSFFSNWLALIRQAQKARLFVSSTRNNNHHANNRLILRTIKQFESNLPNMAWLHWMGSILKSNREGTKKIFSLLDRK